MIVSASRRTDIPAFYSEWFVNRLKEGHVLVRNPRNPNRCSRVVLNPEVVDCIVFWTKNPRPMFDNLDIITKMGYSYYFQFTLTPYDKRIEKGLPSKKAMAEVFKKLSDKVGPRRVVWRYDPVVINEELNVQYHLESFGEMSESLCGYTNRCVFSFMDMYRKLNKRVEGSVHEKIDGLKMTRIADGFSKIARNHQMTLSTCSETIDLEQFGISHASCIDKGMVEKIIGCPISAKKDLNQRAQCRCVESVDVGSYDTCPYGCVYCYATTSHDRVLKNMKLHNKKSSMLIGELNPADIVTDRSAKTLKVSQLPLF